MPVITRLHSPALHCKHQFARNQELNRNDSALKAHRPKSRVVVTRPKLPRSPEWDSELQEPYASICVFCAIYARSCDIGGLCGALGSSFYAPRSTLSSARGYRGSEARYLGARRVEVGGSRAMLPHFQGLRERLRGGWAPGVLAQGISMRRGSSGAWRWALGAWVGGGFGDVARVCQDRKSTRGADMDTLVVSHQTPES